MFNYHCKAKVLQIVMMTINHGKHSHKNDLTKMTNLSHQVLHQKRKTTIKQR
jgi:hypothetical protein